jgi:UDP-3-O-[3-hydroxymyristoyl] glucosamine N-acyltransferase
MTSFTAGELAERLGGRVVGDPATGIKGFAPADRAQPGDLTFAENDIYFARAEQSAASAILVDAEYPGGKKTQIHVTNSRIAFAKVLPLFFPEPKASPGVHATAVVAPTAQIDATAHVGPHCVVGEGARIGPRCVLEALVYVGAGCQLAEEAHLFPHVTLYPRTQVGRRVRIHAGTVVGADGFGYVLDGDFHRKIPQIGFVIIQDDVELGANMAIDRGALGPTVIGRGTKIDNLVQIGHNVAVGEHCLIVAQTGVAGSTRMGNFVTLAGQVGLAGHLRIGHRVMVAAQSGVMNHIPDGEKWMGAPARPGHQMKRQLIAVERLPELLRRVGELERRLAAVSPASADPDSSVPPPSA